MAGDAVFAAGDAGETVAQLGGAEVGEEAELAEVDAEDGRLAVAHLAGGAEDGAVAAEDEREVGGQAGQVGFLAEVVEDDFGVFAQQRQQAFGLLGDAGTMAIAEDEDAHSRSLPDEGVKRSTIRAACSCTTAQDEPGVAVVQASPRRLRSVQSGETQLHLPAPEQRVFRLRRQRGRCSSNGSLVPRFRTGKTL